MRPRKDKMDNLFKEYYRAKRPPEMLNECRNVESMPIGSSYELFSCKDAIMSPKMQEPCPSISHLGAYIDSTLDDKAMAAIKSHIKRCRKCKEKVELGSELIREYKEGSLESTPDDISSDTSSKLDTYHKKSSYPKKDKKSL